MAVNRLVYEPQNAPNIDGVISGPVTFACGSGNFAAIIGDFVADETTHPILACCPDANLGALCASDGGMKALGTLSGGTCPICTTSLKSGAYSETDLTCTTAATSLSTLINYDLTGGYWIADLPFADSAGDWANWRTLLYCDGGVMKCIVIDANNCPQWTGSLISSDCVNLAFRFEFGEPPIFCCDESIGNAYIDWTP